MSGHHPTASDAPFKCRFAGGLMVARFGYWVHVPGVPKHMKRFESLITFYSTKICCLLLFFMNVFFHRNFIMQYFNSISFYENARFSFLKMVFNFLVYTVFTSIASFLTLYIYWFRLQHCIDIHFLMLSHVNIYYVYTYLSKLLSSLVFLKFYNQDSNYITTLFIMSIFKTF